MTLLDPPEYDHHAYLFAPSVDFPLVVALPERQSLPEGEVLTYRFANGYGAAVVRAWGERAEHAFEFCVLDCTGPAPQPTAQTPVCAGLLGALSQERAADLLLQAEALPPHPRLRDADARLAREEF